MVECCMTTLTPQNDLNKAVTSSQFTSLYPELLASITQYLSAFHITRLWICGSIGLQGTLSRSGVHTWRFQVGPRFTRLTWPVSLLRALQAPNFVITLPSKLIPLATESIVASLPSTLRRLELISTYDDILPSVSYGSFSSFASFEHLIELHLGFENALKDPEALNFLPTNLRTLRAVADFTNLDSRVKPLLNLESLSLRLIRPSEIYLKFDMLPNLTSLRLSACGPVSLGALPENLKSLHFPMIMDHKTIQGLPSGLVSLSTIFATVNALSLALALPRALTDLDIDSTCVSNFTAPFDFIGALPRTLKALDLGSIKVFPRTSPQLPPSLSLLSAEFCLDHRDQSAEVFLPSTLEHFVQRGPVMRVANPLPPNLRSLSCPALNINSAVRTTWPEHLSTLITCVDESRDMRGPPKGSSFQLSVEALLDRHFADIDESLRIPESLTHLNVYFLRGSLLTALMGPQLQTLKLATDVSAIDSTFLPRWSKVLPSTLTDLEVRGVPIDEQWLDHVNLPHLRFLHLERFNVPEDRLTALPTSLEKIDIDQFPFFQWAVDLKKYNRLRFLRIATKDVHPPTFLPSLLPSSLEKLSIPVSASSPIRKILYGLRIEIDPNGGHFLQPKLDHAPINLFASS